MPTTFFDFSAKNIDGKPVRLSDYRGKTLLIVNTASMCGFTPQYASLETLYKTYKARGFEILAFPSNDFGAQEPGSDSEIKSFCSLNYKTSFPLFSKVAVIGDGADPLFKWLSAGGASVASGPISWNFHKFVVGPDGNLRARFSSEIDPMAPEITQTIEKYLV